LRTEQLISKWLARAICHISGVGYYELYINGQKVGNNVLDVGWTSWNQSVLYSTYDITNLVLPSQEYAFGLMMGRGWLKLF